MPRHRRRAGRHCHRRRNGKPTPLSLLTPDDGPEEIARRGSLYTARLAIYGGIDKANLKAAGAVLNFNTNNTEMLRTVHLTIGAPVNPRVAKEVQKFASADELEMLAVVAADRAADRNPRFEAPAGSSTWRSIMTRVAEEVALDKSTTTDAASKMIDEIKTALRRAS